MSVFTVLPMSQEVELKAGEVFEGYITVANPADAKEDLHYEILVSPYAVTDEDYTADLINQSDWSQIVEWIEIEEPSGVLRPNETRKVAFKINVPEDAAGGGQYAAINVRSADSVMIEDKINIENVFEVASVIFADVDGEVITGGRILDAHVPGFSFDNPIEVSVMLENTGNVHEKAVTSLYVKNILSGEVIASPEAGNQYVEYIMPDSQRFLTREINGMADLGFYEVRQEVQFLGETKVVNQTVFMCPAWFLVLVFLTVVAIIWVITGRILRRKKSRNTY